MEGIDFVVTWVDGSDEEWRAEKKQYLPVGEVDDRPERYRDWDLLKYWFRGVEKFAPWVRKVHFVTWGHKPEWLNVSNEKLAVVRHEDFIPNEWLPTFNCNAIELNLHRIKNLSENFVYFNDDMFVVGDLPENYFFEGNLPKDMLAFQPVVANPANPVMSHLFLNNALVLSKHFDKRSNVKMQPGKYFKIGYPPKYFLYNLLELAFPKFTGFYTVHGPYPFSKSTYETIWSKEEKVMAATCANRFRSKDDVTTYLIREWKKLTGEFKAVNVQKDFKYYDAKDDNSELANALKKHKSKIICINDANDKIDFDKAKAEIIAAFETILPEKSSFEL